MPPEERGGEGSHGLSLPRITQEPERNAERINRDMRSQYLAVLRAPYSNEDHSHWVRQRKDKTSSHRIGSRDGKERSKVTSKIGPLFKHEGQDGE